MEVTEQITQQVAGTAIAEPPEDEAAVRGMLEFLQWIEKSKGLTLCQAFKPQYDWFVPAFANKERLAREFLAMAGPVAFDRRNQGG